MRGGVRHFISGGVRSSSSNSQLYRRCQYSNTPQSYRDKTNDIYPATSSSSLKLNNGINGNSNNSLLSSSSSYVIRKVEKAPIASLFERQNGNRNNNNNNRPARVKYRRSPRRHQLQQYRIQQQQQDEDGSNTYNYDNTTKNLNGKKLMPRASSYSKYYLPPHNNNKTTSSLHNNSSSSKKQEEEKNSLLISSSNMKNITNVLGSNVIIMAVTSLSRAFQRVKAAIGMGDDNTYSQQSQPQPQPQEDDDIIDESHSHPMNRRSTRRYQCPDCKQMFRRWRALEKQMRHCASCTSEPAMYWNDEAEEYIINPKAYTVYIEKSTLSKTGARFSNNDHGHRTFYNNSHEWRFNKNMGGEMKRETSKPIKKWMVPKAYRINDNNNDSTTLSSSSSPTEPQTKPDPKKYQCSQCNLTTNKWRTFRGYIRSCTMCSTWEESNKSAPKRQRSGMSRNEFLKVLYAAR